MVETGPTTLPSGVAPATISTSATTERAFGRGDRAFFQIYQGTVHRCDRASDHTCASSIVVARSRATSPSCLPRLTFTRRTDGRINVPIDGLLPGDYLLEIVATAGDEHEMRKVRFAVQ